MLRGVSKARREKENQFDPTTDGKKVNRRKKRRTGKVFSILEPAGAEEAMRWG